MAELEYFFAERLVREHAEIVGEALQDEDANQPWMWEFRVALEKFPDSEEIDESPLLLSSQVHSALVPQEQDDGMGATEEQKEAVLNKEQSKLPTFSQKPCLASQPHFQGKEYEIVVDRSPNLGQIGRPFQIASLNPPTEHQEEELVQGITEEQKCESDHPLNWHVLMGKKHIYRQDEIYKLVIRQLVKYARQSFTAFVEERGARKLPSPEIKENLLRAFLRLHYNLELRRDEVELAKSLLYSFSLKLQECGEESKRLRRVREMRSLFLERGTQKEAEDFFKRELTICCFFSDFTAAMAFAGREKHIKEKWKIVRGYKKLIKRLHSSPAFISHFKTIQEKGYKIPEMFAPRH